MSECGDGGKHVFSSYFVCKMSQSCLKKDGDSGIQLAAPIPILILISGVTPTA